MTLYLLHNPLSLSFLIWNMGINCTYSAELDARTRGGVSVKDLVYKGCLHFSYYFKQSFTSLASLGDYVRAKGRLFPWFLTQCFSTSNKGCMYHVVVAVG